MCLILYSVLIKVLKLSLTIEWHQQNNPFILLRGDNVQTAVEFNLMFVSISMLCKNAWCIVKSKYSVTVRRTSTKLGMFAGNNFQWTNCDLEMLYKCFCFVDTLLKECW